MTSKAMPEKPHVQTKLFLGNSNWVQFDDQFDAFVCEKYGKTGEVLQTGLEQDFEFVEPDELPPKNSFAQHAIMTSYADLKTAEVTDGIAKVKLIGAIWSHICSESEQKVRASKEYHGIGHTTVAARTGMPEHEIKSTFSPLQLWMCVKAVHMVPHPDIVITRLLERRAFHRLHQSNPSLDLDAYAMSFKE